MKARIVEIFETIQGEGKFSGYSAIFVRLWGCNLRCRFNGVECDTPYAVYKEIDNAPMMEHSEAVKKILAISKKHDTRHIVWTGGEPTMFQEFITACVDVLGVRFRHEVETNGTKPLTQIFSYHIDWFNISVKLKSSNQIDTKIKLVDPVVLKTFPSKRSCFKFVINSDMDMIEINQIRKIRPLPTYLMPQGATRKELIENSERTIMLCIKHKFLFTQRDHIIVWDNKRGV